MLLKLAGGDPETGDRVLANHRMSEAQTKRQGIPCARNCAGCWRCSGDRVEELLPKCPEQ